MIGIELDVLEHGERARVFLDGTGSFIVERCPVCGVASRFVGFVAPLRITSSVWCKGCKRRRRIEQTRNRLRGLIRHLDRGDPWPRSLEDAIRHGEACALLNRLDDALAKAST